MERELSKLSSTNFDLIVIGGGITGASVAYEASSRGLRVALLEKGDFGQATTSATSKLIHGGLRYLKNLEFGLVRESLTERKVWENIAPNFVYPIPFMVPTYKSFKSNRYVLLMGMLLYDILSYDKGWTWDSSKKLPYHKSIGAKKTLSLETCIKTKGLTGSSIYYDCQNINPERLTLAVLKSAVANGAQVANYARVNSFINSNGSIQGVNFEDLITGEMYSVQAKLIINCAGPWADIVLNLASGAHSNHHIRRSEGIHIITSKLCNTHAVTMMTKSGRHVMIIPWRNHTLIGTTDKEYNGDPDNYCVSKESIQGLIDDVNDNYGCKKLQYEDVIYAYGGLRPLVDDQTEGSYESSRKYEIFDNQKDGLSGLITIEGGKYTTSRRLAFQAMKMVQRKLGIKLPKSRTKHMHLTPCHINSMEQFLKDLALQYPEFSIQTIEYIGKNYGVDSHSVLSIAQQDKALAEVLMHDGEILAEVVYAIEYEMAQSLTDIIFRRTGIGTLGYPGDDVFKKVVTLCKTYFEWDDTQQQNEVELAMKHFKLPV